MKTNKPIIGLLVLLSCLLMMTSACGKKVVRSAGGSADLSSEKVDHKAPDNANSSDSSGDPLVPSDGMQSGEVEALSASDFHEDSADRSSIARRGWLGNSGIENIKSQSAVSGRSSDDSVPGVHKTWSAGKKGVHFSHGLQDIFFAYDSWRLSEKSHRILESNAEWLKANPHERISIEGHCDERGTRAYNYVLGEKRAAMVKQYLSYLGVPSKQMVVASFGKERPTCHVFTTACFQANRRVHFETDMNVAARD